MTDVKVIFIIFVVFVLAAITYGTWYAMRTPAPNSFKNEVYGSARITYQNGDVDTVCIPKNCYFTNGCIVYANRHNICGVRYFTLIDTCK